MQNKKKAFTLTPYFAHIVRLHLDLHSALGAWQTLSEVGQQVGNIIPRMTVQASAQSLLIEVVGNETDASAEHEQTVQDTHREVVLSLLSGERTTVAHQVNKADGNATIDVEDQVVLLRGGDTLDSQSVVEQLVVGELIQDVLLDQLDTQVRVVARLDSVTDTGDELVGLAHAVNELAGAQALVESTGELLGSSVQSTTKSRTNGQQTRDQSADEVLASTSGDDGVHGTRHGGTVVSSKHENHLQELRGVFGQTTTEPQERHDTTDANVLLEHVRDGHTGVEKLLATVVGDGGDESGGLSDETELLSPRVVNGDLGDNGLRLGHNGALLDELVIDLLQDLGHVLEGVGNVEAGIAHGLVLGGGGLKLRVGERAGVTKLNLSLEHAGAGTNCPSNNGLGDDALLDGLNDLVFLNTTDFTEQDENLALRVGLVAQHVVNEGGTWVSVTTNGDTLVHTVGVLRDDIVQLVGHTAGLGDVTDGTLTVELRSDDVVHHTTSVTDLEAARLDATDRGGANNGDTLFLGDVGNLTSSLCNDYILATSSKESNSSDTPFYNPTQWPLSRSLGEQNLRAQEHLQQ